MSEDVVNFLKSVKSVEDKRRVVNPAVDHNIYSTFPWMTYISEEPEGHHVGCLSCSHFMLVPFLNRLDESQASILSLDPGRGLLVEPSILKKHHKSQVHKATWPRYCVITGKLDKSIGLTTIRSMITDGLISESGEPVVHNEERKKILEERKKAHFEKTKRKRTGEEEKSRKKRKTVETFRGVVFKPESGVYQVIIKFEETTYRGGIYTTGRAAAMAYDRLLVFVSDRITEKATLNFPEFWQQLCIDEKLMLEPKEGQHLCQVNNMVPVKKNERFIYKHNEDILFCKIKGDEGSCHNVVIHFGESSAPRHEGAPPKPILAVRKQSPTSTKRGKQRKRKNPKNNKVCEVCYKAVENTELSCKTCFTFYHFHCVDVDENSTELGSWNCEDCLHQKEQARKTKDAVPPKPESVEKAKLLRDAIFKRKTEIRNDWELTVIDGIPFWSANPKDDIL